MTLNYSIKYKTENKYENTVSEAIWQFLITPENNDTQELLSSDFNSSLDVNIENSINGYDFKTSRINCKEPFNNIEFTATFNLIKKEINPFNFVPSSDITIEYNLINSLSFKVDHEPFLKTTPLTLLTKKHRDIFNFDLQKSIFNNLLDLNNWVYKYLHFKPGKTDVNSLLKNIIEDRHGVCQDFSHLFCAIARKNGIPTRYVSGYLHQGEGYFGDSQMHAWAEAYIPEIGWIGFDPTNDTLENHNHIKVAHGKDYNDCAPIKGVIYSTGKNSTKQTVKVTYQEQ